MSRTVIFNNFKPLTISRNKYERGRFEIWDANLHHGDVRPFACPEQIKPGSSSNEIIYSAKENPCGVIQGSSRYVKLVKGFDHDIYYGLTTNGDVRVVTKNNMCADTLGRRAGVPIPIHERAFISPQYNGPNDPCVDDMKCGVARVSIAITYVTQEGNKEIESAPAIGDVYSNIDLNNMSSLVLYSGAWSPSDGYNPGDFNITKVRYYISVISSSDKTSSSPDSAFLGEYGLLHELKTADYPNGWSSQNMSNFEIPMHRTDYYVPSNLYDITSGPPLTTYEPEAFAIPDGADLVGLARTTDGIVVADKHRVLISVAGQPQFTYDGIVDIEDEVVDITAIGNTIFVFTDNYPVRIEYGLREGAMVVEKTIIYRKLPLIYKDSLSTYGSSVYFASTNNIYIWSVAGYGDDINASIQPLMTPEQYRNLGAITGTGYELGYICSGSRINYSLMIEIGGDGTDTINGTSIMPISFINGRKFTLSNDGIIYYQSQDDYALYKWEWRRMGRVTSDYGYNIQDNTVPTRAEMCEGYCPWKVILYFDNEGKNRFSKMRVEWDERSAPEIKVQFNSDGFGQEFPIGNEMSVVRSRAFSIPKFRSYQSFNVELNSYAIMHEVRLATSNQELTQDSNQLVNT